MKKDRRLARILALQALYQQIYLEKNELDEEFLIELLVKAHTKEEDLNEEKNEENEEDESEPSLPFDLKKTEEYYNTLTQGVLENRKLIDNTINEHLNQWTLDRLTSIDSNILRIASYELLKEPEIAPPVVINEAVEITQKFSDKSAAKLVNGVLQSIWNELKEEV